jgi:hypothetical protein
LNNTGTDWMETWLLDYPDDFRPSWWIKPRRLQLHLGIVW